MPLKNLLIATPSMGGVVKAKTAASLVMLMRQLTRFGVAADFLNIDAADIVYARNLFARMVLGSRTLDGLLFVDSDMQFRPLLVLKMLRLEVDFAAAAYPRRQLDPARLAQALSVAEDDSEDARARALAQAFQYTVMPSWDSSGPTRLPLRQGFASMAAAGMGCALISRAALQAMVDGGVVEERTDIVAGVEQRGWGFFDAVKLGGVTLSEDYSFCCRWTRRLGRELWVNVDEHVTHLGEFGFRARYLDRLQLLEPPESSDAPDPAPATAG